MHCIDIQLSACVFLEHSSFFSKNCYSKSIDLFDVLTENKLGVSAIYFQDNKHKG